ncbi:histidine kinase dimerization/phosphoacceptor domain -containing protein [Erythrobacter rubeus]|uniref:histidine kinase n=1 Tax=Erythrobacter rubeus TaxID=2760803 RepID=A0ABR8KT04_9SPHN|nr:histidine kinase dimerization/phosphoacceptor domain -containing protein [Erythrobacter rubeus]MBD2841361.1 tetratricopeptide repeat protein [Erythrobacter rubeus]
MSGDTFDQDEMWDAINADPASGRAKALAYLDANPPLSPDNRRRALNIIGVSFAMQGRMDEALVYAHQALDMAMAQNDFVSASRGWTNIGAMEQARGELAAAVEAYGNAVELSKQADQDAVAHDHTLTNFGSLLLEYGRPDDAIELLEEARPVLLADERPTDRAGGFLPLAKAYRRVGRLDDAESLLEEIRGFLDLDESAELTGTLHCEEAQLALARGRTGEARSAAQRCLSVARDSDLLLPQVDALTVLGSAAMSARNINQAKGYLTQLLSSLDQAEAAVSSGSDPAPSIVRRRLEASRLASDIAISEGRLSDALENFRTRIALDETLDGIASKAGSALDTFRYRQEINTLNLQLLESEAATLQSRNAQQQQFIFGALLLAGLLALLVWVFFRSDRQKRALNAALQRSLDGQRLLNLDMQHRVKNNLQLLLSLLNLQLQSASSESASAVKSVRNRILSMAALYNNLYTDEESDVGATISAKDMLPELIGRIASTYEANNRVGTVSIADIHFDKATASPLGLLVAELVSNVFKHTDESFDLSLLAKENDRIVLTIADRGPAFSANADFKTGGGLDIVNELALQIGGTLEHWSLSPKGNEWTLEFSDRAAPVKRAAR